MLLRVSFLFCCIECAGAVFEDSTKDLLFNFDVEFFSAAGTNARMLSLNFFQPDFRLAGRTGTVDMGPAVFPFVLLQQEPFSDSFCQL